jgi:hypothetical protein
MHKHKGSTHDTQRPILPLPRGTPQRPAVSLPAITQRPALPLPRDTQGPSLYRHSDIQQPTLPRLANLDQQPTLDNIYQQHGEDSHNAFGELVEKQKVAQSQP